MIKNNVFLTGDIIEITGKNVKEKYRGMRGRITRWHHDNVYTVTVFLSFSEIEIILKANEMTLIQSDREYPTD